MHTITKVIKLGEKTGRVELDDGRKVRLPVSCISIGFISDEDIRQKETPNGVELLHYSLYKEPRKRTEPVLCRDMAQFDVKRELALLRSIIIKNLFVLGRVLSEEALDDMVEDCFLHFWERSLFQRYNSEKLRNYNSYLSRAVRNYLIDLKRNSKYKHDTYHRSLNAPLKNDTDGNSLMDYLEDERTEVEGSAIRDLLLENYGDLLLSFRRTTEQLDREEETGLNFTYLDLFKALFISCDYDGFVKQTGYSVSTVNTRKKFLLDMLYPTYKEYRYA